VYQGKSVIVNVTDECSTGLTSCNTTPRSQPCCISRCSLTRMSMSSICNGVGSEEVPLRPARCSYCAKCAKFTDFCGYHIIIITPSGLSAERFLLSTRVRVNWEGPKILLCSLLHYCRIRLPSSVLVQTARLAALTCVKFRTSMRQYHSETTRHKFKRALLDYKKMQGMTTPRDTKTWCGIGANPNCSNTTTEEIRSYFRDQSASLLWCES